MQQGKNNSSLRTSLRTLLIALLGICLLIGTAGRADAVTRTACFRILHASPDSPNFDVYGNRTRVATDLAYAQFIPRRWCIAATAMLVRAYQAGADPDLVGPLVSSIVNFQIGKSYVIAIANVAGQLQVVVLENPAIPPRGQFALRLAHLAPGVNGLDLATTGGEIWLTNVVFPTAQTTVRNVGSYDLVLQQTGTPNVVLPLGVQLFASRERKTIYVLAATPADVAAAQARDVPAAPRFVIEADR